MSDNDSDEFEDAGQYFSQISQEQPKISQSQVKNTQVKINNLKQLTVEKQRINRVQRKRYHFQKHKINIKESKNQIDMNFLQNRYYSITIKKQSNQKTETILVENIERRYSDFDLLYQILNRQYKSYILPAFPQKGLVSYVKTKVSAVKDQKLIQNRIKMIERFIKILLSEQEMFNLNISKENQKKLLQSQKKSLILKKFFSAEIASYEYFKNLRKCTLFIMIQYKQKTIIPVQFNQHFHL